MFQIYNVATKASAVQMQCKLLIVVTVIVLVLRQT